METEGSGGRSGSPGRRIATTLSHIGRDPSAFHGFVNPPLVRASTVLFPDTATMLDRHGNRYPYGLMNTPTIEALVTAMNELEGAAGTVLVPSGLAAVTLPILAMARAGTEILVPDNVYGPTRRFCRESLPALGVTARFYDPLDLAALPALLGNASIVFLEAPGSLTFETPDVPAIVALAKAHGATTMIDNTWATPLIYRPLEHGVDIVLHAGTKYLAGHSDVLIGTVSANPAIWPKLQEFHRNLGIQAGPEEIWLTLRGLRTMGIRLERHERSALQIAQWLAARADVARVLHPAFPDCPGHAIWKRDFGRSTGLFGFVLRGDKDGAARFLDALRLFGLGFSWGGFESLAVVAELGETRTVRPWTEGPVIRLQIGLEDPSDLIADLEAGFSAVG